MTFRGEDISGQVFGGLKVLRRVDLKRQGQAWFWCLCECGVEKAVARGALRGGKSVSYGCRRRSLLGARGTTHGHARCGKRTPEYEAWKHMIHRCEAPNDRRWVDYGGRGIRVCSKWRASYVAFLADVGPRPSPKHSLDRIDVNGPYEPGNVRWASRVQQMRNTRRNRFLECNGERATLSEWAERTGIKRATIAYRIDRLGWPTDQALEVA